MKEAGGMAYVTLLSLVPSLVAVFVVLSTFSPMLGKEGMLLEQFRSWLLTNLAAGSGESVIQYLDSLIATLDLAKLGYSSFAVVLVSLILLLRNIEGALNRVWLVRKERNVFMRFVYFWTFLTLSVFTLSLVIGLSAGAEISNFLSPEDVKEVGQSYGLFTWGVAFVFFFMLYKFVPNTFVSNREAAVGSIVATILFTAATRFYGLFVNFDRYELLYGALAAIPVFLVWLYICWLIILLGSLIAWRYSQGIPQEKETNALEEPANAMDRYRNIQLQTIVPSLCLVAIYRSFSEATGKGITLRDLCQDMHLPPNWVQDGLEALIQLGYIVETAPSDDNLEEQRYYPTRPADTLATETFFGDLSSPVRDWVSNWSKELSSDLRQAIDKIIPLQEKGGTKGNLAEIFA